MAQRRFDLLVHPAGDESHGQGRRGRQARRTASHEHGDRGGDRGVEGQAGAQGQTGEAQEFAATSQDKPLLRISEKHPEKGSYYDGSGNHELPDLDRVELQARG